LASTVCSQHSCSQRTVRSSQVRRQEARRTDPYTLAERQECHLGRHRHGHSGAVVSASDVGVVWWGSGGGSREKDSQVPAAGTDIHFRSNCSWNPRANEHRWTAVPQRLRKAHYPSFYWPTRERFPLPTSVSSYPAFQCSRCTWHFCPHAHCGWFLAVPA